MEATNKPYVKKYINGKLSNPITKESPYLTRSERKIKRGLERFVVLETLKIVKHERKSTRGRWIEINRFKLN